MDRLVALSSPPVVANCSANVVDEDPVMMDQSCITLFVHLPCAGWFRSFPACCAVCYSYLSAQSVPLTPTEVICHHGVLAKLVTQVLLAHLPSVGLRSHTECIAFSVCPRTSLWSSVVA